ncbi:MAG TPA: peptide ABC transporter substrate-binding protein [Pyrinomonadaceae bacterium]|nr:peptide ABC transporter substrate-binding protein [Pyrinomonadaceae bacterium]
MRDVDSNPKWSLPLRAVLSGFVVAFVLIIAACNGSESTGNEPYYARTEPPRKQEFRWSNGKLPKTLDPAFAAAPPETDLVRAVFEGLTELDPQTLEAKPGVAEKWTPSEDLRSWTFHLRADAKWSNGKPVTAQDFVRSWKRLGELGTAVPHHDLLANIVGFPIKKKPATVPSTELIPNTNQNIPSHPPPAAPLPDSSPGPAPAPFGVVADDDRTLRVLLVVPDKDLPKLVAHPLFRPIGAESTEFAVTTTIVSNGAFRVSESDASGVTLEPSDSYWNRRAIALERVRMVAAENAEQALAAYKAGDIDAITNADFEPLALKLLEPFNDFRRRPHAAVNFYEINHERAPFDDRRVREALAIAIERERLTEGDMEGTTRPALSFLSFSRDPEAVIVQDISRARDLLAEAGYPRGEGFPAIKLVINRNDTQTRVARAVARMWKQNLNVETEIVVKENAEVETARITGDFDLIRRNAVFPTADELMSILTLLKPPVTPPAANATQSPEPREGVEAEDSRTPNNASSPTPSPVESPDVTMSEANAIFELWAIPLYFPTSYSLVKPYVSGFETNSLDAPSLQSVAIDSNWQPK